MGGGARAERTGELGAGAAPRRAEGRPWGLGTAAWAPHPLGSGRTRVGGTGLTCDLVVIADEAGDVALGKLPLHPGGGEAGVGAGQLGSCGQAHGEREEGAAASGQDRRVPRSPGTWACSPPPPPQPQTTHVYSQELGLQIPKWTLRPCPAPASLSGRRGGPAHQRGAAVRHCGGTAGSGGPGSS